MSGLVCQASQGPDHQPAVDRGPWSHQGPEQRALEMKTEHVRVLALATVACAVGETGTQLHPPSCNSQGFYLKLP